MFLVRDKVHPEDVWRDWLLPISKVVHPDIECDAQVKHCYKETLMLQPARSVYDEQGFFTFYVHAKPGAPAAPRGSVFYEREVKDPVEVWHSSYIHAASVSLSSYLSATRHSVSPSDEYIRSGDSRHEAVHDTAWAAMASGCSALQLLPCVCSRLCTQLLMPL